MKKVSKQSSARGKEIKRGETKRGVRRVKPAGFSFKREAKWMTAMNLAPLGIGMLLALIFWFTR